MSIRTLQSVPSIKTFTSRNALELLFTAAFALIIACLHMFFFIPATLGMLGAVIAFPLLLKKPEYGGFALAILFPFNDVYLISAISLYRLVVWGLFFYMLIRQFTASHNLYTREFSLFNKSVIFFLMAMAISVLQTASKLYTTFYLTPTAFKSIFFSNMLKIIEHILIVYILYYSMSTLKQLQRLIDIMIAISAFIASLGLLQYFLRDTPPIVGFLFYPEYQFYGRTTSIFSNPNYFGHYLAFIIGTSLVSLCWQKMSILKRWGFIFPILLLDIAAIIVSFSRSAMVSLFFSMLVISYVYYVKICHRKLSWKVIMVAVFIIILVVLAIQNYGLYLRARLSNYDDDEVQQALKWMQTTSDYIRKYAALQALRTAIRHPFLGIGFDVFMGEMLGAGYAVDNQYLKIMVEMGLLGFIPFIVMLGIVIRTGLKFWPRQATVHVSPDVQLFVFLLLTGFCTVLCSYLFADTLHRQSITGNLWMFASAIFILNREYFPATQQQSVNSPAKVNPVKQ